MNKLLSRPIALAALLPPLARAHEGHGLHGMHWHATDVLGYLLVAVIAAIAIWNLRK